MIFQRRWGFGIGSLFSLIVVYFIFLYARGQGWTLLAFISKWYLIIMGGLFALSFAIILLILLLYLLIFLKHKKHKNKEYVDVEFTVKE